MATSCQDLHVPNVSVLFFIFYFFLFYFLSTLTSKSSAEPGVQFLPSCVVSTRGMDL